MSLVSEGQFLEEKILSHKSHFEKEDIRGGCLGEAFKLYEQFGGGTIFWIGNLSKISLDFGIHHAYFVPPNADDNQLALNQADNGFGEYPPLTVKEVRTLGEPQDINIVREILKSNR